jgi:hypothetical protein
LRPQNAATQRQIANLQATSALISIFILTTEIIRGYFRPFRRICRAGHTLAAS